jgi:dihydropyrimidinase
MILIKNGYIVTTDQVIKGNLLIQNSKISAIGENLNYEGAKVIDAENKYILPGCIDVHTHMQLPFGGTVSADDFETGTKAAAFGGVTTIIDFATQAKGQWLKDALEARQEEAKNSYIDYGLHIAITDLKENIIDEMKEVIQKGCPTFKLFMTYPNLAVDDYTLFNAIKTASQNNGMISVHAENLSMIVENTKRLLEKGCIEPKYHAISRPDYVEAEAVSRACMWAEETGGKLYIVHLSSGKGLQKIKESVQRGGNIYAETCLQYLMLEDSCYEEKDFGGAKYVMSPPIRKKEDNDRLWKGIADNNIQVIGSDHCPFNMEQKRLGINSFAAIPNGGPGVETSLMLLYTYGVLKKRITLNKMVEVLAYNPAKIFGIKDKGSIAIGKDADLVIFNPNKKMVLSKDTLHSNIDYSIYEGLEVTGIPEITISRGKIICDNGNFLGEKGYGKYLNRYL